MPLRQNPLDRLAENLAEWADMISTEMADALKGGLAAPGAARLSQQQMLEYYSHQLFNPDGTPNLEGRAKEIDRLGAVQFAEVMKNVLEVHPEWKFERPQFGGPEPDAHLVPTHVPGVSEVVATPPQQTQPTDVPGVSEVVGEPVAQTAG